MSKNSFGAASELRVGGDSYRIFSLSAAGDVSRLPYSLKVLLENLLRNEDGRTVQAADIEALVAWDGSSRPGAELAFRPARVLMQDFTGVPAVVDLAVMREAVARLGGDPGFVSPQVPVELVIDHSVTADESGSALAFGANAKLEQARNAERYALLRWGQEAFNAFAVVPPDTGICHQINLEYLSRVIFANEDGTAYPDTVVGTDSHTPMVNGLGVLGWGVGGIEAEAAMLGQPISMLVPPVVGVKLVGEMAKGATATDLVLTIAELLRKVGVVGKFVEFYGPGVAAVPLENRATIGNMSPEYGSTCAVFPIDDETLRYLRFTGRTEAQVALVEAYAKAQGLFADPAAPTPAYSEHVELDLSKIEPSVAGPSRPQDRVPLHRAKAAMRSALGDRGSSTAAGGEGNKGDGESKLDHGAVVIAAITSCTNTSNPQVMVAAGLLARKAVVAGLAPKPWVKTSLAPGSKVVTAYLDAAGLTEDLDRLGFNLVGYGCTTCIGNSGPLLEGVSEAIAAGGLSVSAVLSGNRNFEGRIHPDVRMNWLASPPLVVAYALSGTMDIDLTKDPIGKDRSGRDVYLADLWPTEAEVAEVIRDSVRSEMFSAAYDRVYAGDEAWAAMEVADSASFAWTEGSTYVKRAPFLDHHGAEPGRIAPTEGARALVVLGDSVTTDHISPAGSIQPDSPAGRYLQDHGVPRSEFNSYGARRGNHEVMVRGTFANVRLRNRLAGGAEGGVTRHLPSGEVTSIYEASLRYAQDGIPLVVLAGKEYGSGSSRDWAAKGPALLGVRAVIAEGFERIHRSNLLGMGILPLQFLPGESIESLGLTGEEAFDIALPEHFGEAYAARHIKVTAGSKEFEVVVRMDTPIEVEYFRHGGILPYVMRQLLAG